MIVECISIIAVISMIFFVFVKAKKFHSGLSVLPLLITPAMHLASKPLSLFFRSSFGIDKNYTTITVHIVSLVLCGIIFGIISKNFKEKSSKLSYLILCGLYTVILTVVLILNSVSF